jgi:trehalose utilization protein
MTNSRWTIGKGRLFHLAPGHETCRDSYGEEVRRIFSNAFEWAAPSH